MTPSDDCVELVKHFEGCFLKAYPDPGTNAEPWTIGYGCTTDVHPGMVITLPEAERRLVVDLAKSAIEVTAMVKVPVAQHQFDALVSFCFNCGAANLRSSTLLRKVNAKDFDGAAAEFLRWTRAAGKVLPGLVRRRTAESNLFKDKPWA